MNRIQKPYKQACRIVLFLFVFVCFNAGILFLPWGSAFLAGIILITYILFLPKFALHPNNMLIVFFGLYIVLSSTLTLILNIINWEYKLPWGQLIFWKDISKYTLCQAESTFLLLFFSFRKFCSEEKMMDMKNSIVNVSGKKLSFIYFFTILLLALFIQRTGGISSWINDYSYTYLVNRKGSGLLNFAIILFSNITVFSLGIKSYYSKGTFRYIALVLILGLPVSMIGGIKSRIVVLILLYLFPYVASLKITIKSIIGLFILFIGTLYLTTILRTEGFYSSAPFFLEYLVGYFNSYQLHDYVVVSRDPNVLQTLHYSFIKPFQILGLIEHDANFDISVMLTKEFFPDQWYKRSATQQWPLDTELYLNFYGIWFSWIPLLFYSYVISNLYSVAITKKRFYFILIYLLEFLRLFTTLRGSILPWQWPIYLIQYLLIYLVCRWLFTVYWAKKTMETNLVTF